MFHYFQGQYLYTHDYIFWSGDFNYRLDIPKVECKELIKAENWGALQACDQLMKEKEQENVSGPLLTPFDNRSCTYHQFEV